MTQIKNSYREQWERARKGKKGNPHYGCGPVTVYEGGKYPRTLNRVKVIKRFDKEGKPIE